METITKNPNNTLENGDREWFDWVDKSEFRAIQASNMSHDKIFSDYYYTYSALLSLSFLMVFLIFLSILIFSEYAQFVGDSPFISVASFLLVLLGIVASGRLARLLAKKKATKTQLLNAWLPVSTNIPVQLPSQSKEVLVEMNIQPS